MLKKFYIENGKLLSLIVTLGVFLGNVALYKPCSWGIYEPTKPDILKSED